MSRKLFRIEYIGCGTFLTDHILDRSFMNQRKRSSCSQQQSLSETINPKGIFQLAECPWRRRVVKLLRWHIRVYDQRFVLTWACWGPCTFETIPWYDRGRWRSNKLYSNAIQLLKADWLRVCYLAHGRAPDFPRLRTPCPWPSRAVITILFHFQTPFNICLWRSLPLSVSFISPPSSEDQTRLGSWSNHWWPWLRRLGNLLELWEMGFSFRLCFWL